MAEFRPEDIIDFWFSEPARSYWWKADANFDHRLRDRFGALLDAAAEGALDSWRATPPGRLAEIIVLDQFSRNMHRGRAEAFAQDQLARCLALEAIEAGADQELPAEQCAFLYMPLMHSESAADHERAVELFSSDADLAHNLEFEQKHKNIIDRFGRYPHRNAVLGRESTPEEIEFLKQPGSSF